MQPIAPRYETDFYAWAQHQAHLLRTEELEKLDLANLAEEIEAMASRDRREIISRLIVLLMHLLKWQYQPDPHGYTQPRSWRNIINTQRREIGLVLDDSPSLRREMSTFLSGAYPKACRAAAEETGLALATFPTICPYTLDQILNEDFFPA